MAIYKEIHGTVIGKGKLDIFIPKTTVSIKWKHWQAVLDIKTCEPCRNRHGKIYPMNEEVNPSLEMHDFCRCMVLPWNKGVLPDYYIVINDLFALGWRPGKAPAKYAPDQMLTRGIYRNDDGHLPDAPGRIWFEADLNYYRGKRNGHRVLWSNDGLMFVTYNHYESFIEVIGG